MAWASLTEWWNFIFALPLGVGLLLGAGFALGGLIDVGGDDADSDGADDADGDSDDHEAFWSHLLHWFGIGMGVPLTLLIPVLLMAWGLAGLIANRSLEPWLRLPSLYFPISLVMALGAAMLTGRFATFLVRKMGIFDETPAPTRHDLIGCSGYAVFPINEREGVANVKSRTGDIHRITCKTPHGHPLIPAGTELIVVEYNNESGDFLVEAHPFAMQPTSTLQQENLEPQQTQIGGQTQ